MADAQVPTGPAGLTAEEWNALGLPVAGPAEPQWSADLTTATTQDLAAGHPLSGRSPWPANAND